MPYDIDQTIDDLHIKDTPQGTFRERIQWAHNVVGVGFVHVVFVEQERVIAVPPLYPPGFQFWLLDIDPTCQEPATHRRRERDEHQYHVAKTKVVRAATEMLSPGKNGCEEAVQNAMLWGHTEEEAAQQREHSQDHEGHAHRRRGFMQVFCHVRLNSRGPIKG